MARRRRPRGLRRARADRVHAGRRVRHADLYRRASRRHERGLRRAVEAALASLADGGVGEFLLRGAGRIFEACVAVFRTRPRARSSADEQRKVAAIPRASDDAEPLRVALIADGIGATHGVSRTIAEIRERGVPGCEIEVIGTDPAVDHRLRRSANSTCPSTRGCESAYRACRPQSTRSVRGASTSSTSVPPARRG